MVVTELAAASTAFRDAGFTVTPGGRHDGIPTENALVAFADGSYLELLAMRERPARDELRRLRAGPRWEAHLRGASAIARRFLPRLAGPDGVGDACLRAARLARFAAESRRRGFAFAGPVAMRRERRTGAALAWELLLPADDALPFLIEDRTPRAERVSGDAAATAHGNGARGIAGLELRSRDPARTALACVELFGARARALPDGGTRLGFAGLELRLGAGEPEGACGVLLAGIASLPAGLAALGIRGEADGGD